MTTVLRAWAKYIPSPSTVDRLARAYRAIYEAAQTVVDEHVKIDVEEEVEAA